ncbi:MAG: glutathione S-transferase N-terminal domain-containing protein [Gammaproteobacteria bacterium]|nr:glutathione S-transferase N-terminal domain-containing protein [Gammaproteobacteria bacterium]
MIELHSWPTPNGQKVHIMLEETGLEYRAIPVDINAGEQFKPEFLNTSPNNKIPAIVDRDGPGGQPMALAESGAILVYLAEKAGQFLPNEPRQRYAVLQWLMFQMGHIGPMLGQAHHFRGYAPIRISYGIERYTRESNRLYGVLDRQLAESEYVAGNAYTLADIAIFPWLRSHAKQGVALEDYAQVKRWFDAIDARPAVRRGLEVLKEEGTASRADGFENLFGNRQFQRR